MQMDGLRRLPVALVIVAAVLSAGAATEPTVTIEKPKPRTVTGGSCGIPSGDSFSGTFGPSALPALSFVIGPASAMADQMHADKTKFTGPGKYANVIVAVYLGKTALEDSYGGLGTVVINADRRTGTFTLNNGSASGHFDCGTAPSASETPLR
jgi:hypothetical protein